MCICIVNMLSNYGYGLIAPFMPLELEKLNIEESITGFIFSFYSLTVILSAPIIGWILSKYQQRRLQYRIGLLLYSTSMFGFAYAPRYITSKPFLIITLLTLRILQGFGSCSIQTTNLSITSMLYRKHQVRVMACLFGSESVGIIVSPIFGAMLFDYGGFIFPFEVYGVLFLFSSFIIPRLIPSKVDGDISIEKEQLSKSHQHILSLDNQESLYTDTKYENDDSYVSSTNSVQIL